MVRMQQWVKGLSLRKKIMGVLLICFLTWFWNCLPNQLFTEPTSYVIEDKNGNLLNATIAEDGQWRFPAGNEVPDKFIQCITTFEDKRFYSHPGIDPIAIGRALMKDLQKGRKEQGGSTLTMQVIRLSLNNNRRSIWNKMRECIMAVRAEIRYSKTDILALYAAHAPFGSNVVGLEAAAWRYFGRKPNELSWGEMATLAVLPNAPSLVHPGKNRTVLMAKRNALLNQLLAAKKIDSSTCELAKMETLPDAPLPLPQMAPHLFQRFRNETRNASGNTRIRTTVEIDLQSSVSRILQHHQGTLQGNGINNACALVLDVETGNALAYVGNINAPRKPEWEADVDVIAAPRSPGSALKPILYAAMLSDGLLLPQQLVPDVPMQIGNYAPQNFDLGFDGAVPAANALARSLNIPAVKMLQQYKYQRFYEVLQQCGIRTLNRSADAYGLSLVLGGCEVTMWDMAGAYASMARALLHAKSNSSASISADFHPPGYGLKKEKVQNNASIPLDPTSIWFTFQAMREVMRPGEEGLWQQFTSSQTIAWKTGTSFGFRDAWAIGITPKYVVAVWVGNADGEGRPGLIGIKTAAPILFDIFHLLPSTEWFQRPTNHFSYVPVCRTSGFRAQADCEFVDTLFMPEKGNNAPMCPYHRKIHLDATGQFRVNETCENPSTMQHVSWFVLSPAMEYYYKQKNADYRLLPPYKPGCEQSVQGDNNRSIELIYPQSDAKIYVPLEMSGERGKTIFTAAHRRADAKIFWSLDDQFLTTTQHFHQVALDPAPGKHIITLVDENGISLSRAFEVLAKEK